MSNNPFPNVMRIDFTKDYDYGNWSEDMVAIFNITKVSEEEVLRFINSGEYYHPMIAVMSQDTWDNIFSKEDN